MYIIDFDNTIFNTHTDPGNFVEMRAKALAELGVSEELFKETSRQIQTPFGTGKVFYTSERHAEAIAEHGLNKQQVYDALHTTLGESLQQYLFPDAINFLQSLKATDKPMILFSFGDPEWQYEKVKGCDIEKYFDRTFFTNKSKAEVVHQLLASVKHSEVWFINDKVEETQKVVAAFPEIKAVLKISCNNSLVDYKNSGLPYFKTLTGIRDYILEKISLQDKKS